MSEYYKDAEKTADVRFAAVKNTYMVQTEANTLTEDTSLAELSQWDSLAILKLQIELIVIRPELSSYNLHDVRR